MSRPDYSIMSTRRFLPLFVTQFLGAFNDNLFKTALVTLITFRLIQDTEQAKILVTVAGGIFILPFFLFSATSGQLADKYDKSRLIQIVKAGEVAIMALGAVGLYLGDVTFLMAVLFLMGLQSTLFGPLKYGVLPDHLSDDELVVGNAIIEAGTFLAILIGTIAGALVVLGDNGWALVAVCVLTAAGFGLVSSLYMPPAPGAAPDLKVNPNFVTETWRIIGFAAERRDIFLSILGISWFWLVGFTFLSQFPTYAKDVLGGDEMVLTLFLTVFSVGIGVGSIVCERILKGEISARTVPFGALGMAIFSLDLYLASATPIATDGAMSVAAFLAEARAWRILIDLLLIAIFGGLFIVPLYAIMQARAAPERRARIVASNNVLNAAFMVGAAGVTTVLFEIGFDIPDIFLTVAVANVLVAIQACRLLPDELVKGLAVSLFRLLYRVEVRGLEHLKAAGEKAVIVVNHASFLDGALLAAVLPGRPMFAIDTMMAQNWWVKPFLALVEAFPVDPTRPLSTKSLIREVNTGKRCVIFPEGRLTVTGALMKVYEGPGMIADKTGAPIVPVRIDGAQFTSFTRLQGKLPIRRFPKIRSTILPPRRFDLPADMKGRARRAQIGRELYDVMSDMMFETQNQTRRTLFEALLAARKVHGGKRPILEDIERRPLGYDRLLLGSLVLGRAMAKGTERGEYIGLLLPNTAGVAVAFFGLVAHGRVPAMLNYSAGAASMLDACAAAGVRKVFTARRFVEAAKLEAAAAALSEKVELVHLEDLRASLGLFDKLGGLARRALAKVGFLPVRVEPEEPAVVLFTSGSEGAPKGVVLSHANLLSNCNQLAARIDFNPSDVTFNALPVFHSFGLTGGLLLPVLFGTKTFLYPSPLHYRVVPEAAYIANATIMFGTDTFLSGYARVAHPYDFYSIRYVFAGAEKLREETRRAWMDKFGVRILEGYGVTECAPAIAVNTAMHFKPGTVGRLLPGIEHRLEDVPGVDEGGRLWVSGPNVMLGYLKKDKPGEIQPPVGGWYDTGDIVSLDNEGFLRIRGRAKRFAKIAGEMVSLTAVEELISTLWPEHAHAVVSLPDARKGEQLVLVTDFEAATRDALLVHGKESSVPELMIPKAIVTVERMPVLGSGKTDVVTATKLAKSRLRIESAA